MGTSTMALPQEYQETVREGLKAVVAPKIDGIQWNDMDHKKISEDCTAEALAYLRAQGDNDGQLKGYGFFVKSSILGVNGFNQCATQYWTAAGMDFSVNVTNNIANAPGEVKQVMVVLTAFASPL